MSRKLKTKEHWTTAMKSENVLLNSKLAEASCDLQLVTLESQKLLQKLKNALGERNEIAVKDGKVNLSEVFASLNFLTDELLLKLENNSPEILRDSDSVTTVSLNRSEFNPTQNSTPSRARHLTNEDDETIGIEDTYSISSPNLADVKIDDSNDISIIPMSQVMENVLDYTTSDFE